MKFCVLTLGCKVNAYEQPNIPISCHMSEQGYEQKYVKEAFDTNWVVPLGPNVNGFEADLERFVNRVGDSSHSLRMT